MAMVINTNMASLNAVRLLDSSSKDQSTAMERLTSGLRINSSADDAAGLAVSERMTLQIRGTEMAIRNANDGISMSQTIDGATEEVVSMMQRIRELGVQSMNETYSPENRLQMDQEVQQLKVEINRIADTTKFNGINLMNETGSLALQAGWETKSNDQIAVATLDMTTDALADFSTAELTATGITTPGVDAVGDFARFNVGATIFGTAEVIDLSFGETVNGVTLDATSSQTDWTNALAYKVNSNETLHGEGINMTVDQTSGAITINSYKVDLDVGDFTVDTANDDVSGGASTADPAITGLAATANAFTGSIDTIDITTTENAQLTVNLVDEALTTINSYRAEVGAKMNRLDHTLSNLSNVNENITAARSRVLDADFATESANLARTQVLQQAGMSMLSQANQASQNVLQLLQ